MTMVTEWHREPGFAAHAPRGASHLATSALARILESFFLWLGGTAGPTREPIDDHLLRDIGLTRADIGLIAHHPRRAR